MQANKHTLSQRILNRLLLIVVVAVVAATTLLIGHNWQQEHAAIHHLGTDWSTDLRDEFSDAIARESRGMAQTLQIIINQPNVIQALAEHDAARLQSDWMDTFGRLKAEYGITHFYFFAPDRTCLLRLHQPEKHGDRINRLTALEAERTGKPASGMEMGETGILTLRVVHPVFKGNRLVGYVELGEEIEHVLRSLHPSNVHDYRLAILLHKNKIVREKWENGMQMLGRHAAWNDLPLDVIEFLDPDLSLEALQANFSSNIDDDDQIHVEMGGRTWNRQLTPLQVKGNEEVGSLLVMRDITGWEDTARHRAAMLILITLLGSGIILSLLFWLTKRYTRQLNEQESQLRDSEMRFRTLFEKSPDPVWIIDNHHFVECNQAAVAMLGYPDQASLKNSHPSVLSPEFQPDGESSYSKAERMMNLAQKSGLHRFEWVHRRKDGSEFYAEVTLSLIELQGRPAIHCLWRNISERKQMIERLSKSEHDLKAAQQIAKLGSWELDIPNNRLSWSDEIFRIFEIDPDRFGASYEAFLDGIHPDDRESVNQAYTDSLKTRKPYSIRHRLLMPDGRIKYVHEQCQTDFDDAGNPIRSIGTVQDVTDLTHSEIALTDAHNLVQSVIEHVPMRVFWKDRALNYLGCNPAFARDAGWSRPEELIGQSDFQMGWANEAELYRSDDQKIIESGTSRINFEEPQTTPDGRTIWLRTSKVPLKNQSGKIIGVLGMYEDITSEKEKDRELDNYRNHLEQLVTERTEQLTEAQLRYQRLVDDMGDEFLAFSYAPDGRVTFVSNSMEAIFGIPKEAILGREWPDTIQWLAEDLHSTEQDLQNLLAGKIEDFQTEMRFIHPNGEVRTIYQTCHAIKTATGMITSVDGILTDITQRKQDETELLAAKQAAETASRYKSAFLANMSHEIRTPMNGVLGMLEILSYSTLPADERRMVETIRRSARSLLGIIDDILDFSKIEAGKFSLTEQEISLETELDNVVDLMDRIAMDKQVRLSTFFDPHLPQCVIGDDLRVRQILINLTGNAVKFSASLERIGRVQLRVELERRVDEWVWVTFTISDNGIGMDDETVTRLFQPFEQADSSTTRRYGGTGLGLTISKSLIAMMGGQISVQSTPKQGTTFTVRLPFKVLSDCPNLATPYDFCGLECVIVADATEYHDEYDRYLLHAGAKIHTFSEIEAAWHFTAQHAQTTPICMIVMEEPGIRSSQEVVDRLLSRQQNDNVSFVNVTYLTVERGKRRTVRRLADRVVQIDREAMTRTRFLTAVATATGRLPVEQQNSHEDHNTVMHEDSRAEHILVAEDNEINRDVIRRQLEMLGYNVTVEADGQKAFNRWQQGGYDLILTDLHMPNKDGYELTSMIRAIEQHKQLNRTPIIALTANALKGEEAHCLEQGMDAYLSKPIELKRLKSVLKQWLPVTDAVTDRAPDESTEDTNPALAVFDPEALTKLVGNNPAIHRRLLEKFLSSTRERNVQLLKAVESGDTEEISQIAHALKSSARSVGALLLGDYFQQLEHAGKAGDRETCRLLGLSLDATFAQATDAITSRLDNE